MMIFLEKKKNFNWKYQNKKLDNLDNINIKDVVNLKNICISGYIHLRNIREFNKEMQNNL